MRNPFRKRVRRGRDPADAVLQDVKRQFGELDERFRRLEESLNRLHARFPQVTIEHLQIHQPVLEKLEFRLDALDIEQLSGSLNLGNNFGAKLASSERKREEPPRTPEGRERPAAGAAARSRDPAGPAAPSRSGEGMERTSTGFRVNYRR
ncbi:hypothetical protein [Cohnella caldifontis]|uniref:hypothetical protein n=1 Tax=Cohnella caldifontis TaxID=3027471 RepID=UPI0023EAE9E2|nr:hypothetical protein [Cohnella sp. YIM B05605]